MLMNAEVTNIIVVTMQLVTIQKEASYVPVTMATTETEQFAKVTYSSVNLNLNQTVAVLPYIYSA